MASTFVQLKLATVKSLFDALKQTTASLEMVTDDTPDNGSFIMRSNGKFIVQIDVIPLGAHRFVIRYPMSKQQYDRYTDTAADVILILQESINALIQAA